MSNLGSALGWKYNHESGICTVNGSITAWPNSLGTVPTDAEQDGIITEYTAWAAITDQIATLEATATPRRIRESASDPTWMNALDAEIALLRGQL
tara:strand:- start:1294 stop:1578 length:285 start_codon:yes stop_codon:yes gene_type:complete